MNPARRFSIILTIFAGLCIMAIGLFVLFLYVIPGFTPLGIAAVYEKSKYTTYMGDEIEALFQERNMIIESNNTEIVVRIRKIGFEDEARITVFENANGIAFNSMNRTQLDFLHYLDEYGEPYTKIMVYEPEGVMSRNAVVYINLKKDDIDGNIPYNFVLNTGLSKVTFEYDLSTEEMAIDHLVINGSGRVSLPAPTEPTATNPGFNLEIEHLDINSSSANVHCLAKVNNVVKVTGNSRSIVLGEIAALMVEGGSHNISADIVNGNVDFICEGKININTEVKGDLKVRGQVIDVNVRKANSVDVEITQGYINVSGVTEDSNVVMETGAVTLGSRVAGLGVYGDVYVHKNYGSTNVTYANDAAATGDCTIKHLDGHIDVHGIRGKVDIFVSAGSYDSNVKVGFMEIAADNSIVVDGSRNPRANDGNITINLLDASLGITLRVDGTYEARCHVPVSEGGKGGVEFDNFGRNNEVYSLLAPRGGSDNVVYVRTLAKFDLRTARY